MLSEKEDNMKSNAPQKQRRFMIPYRAGEDKTYSLLLLNATNYEDAIQIGKCIAGPNIEKFLCYKDFLVYD